ncbi:DUF5615 family PIN-like protein [Flavimaricola marinus]|uniref:DUF5615 family PIN-like protein n=1 Tax=Flavimaricola marinus TaxID=1819565 RepID=UPI0010549570|nr:DUF5615 family PIN-like protein [Flavimaricola marinus]
MKPSLKVFLDEGVPVSVGGEFERAGHEVIYFVEGAKPGSSDDIVALTAQENDAVLVACDGDMKARAKRLGIGNARFRHLSLIRISLKNKVNSRSRIAQAMSLIEHEWEISSKKVARKLFVEISDSVIKTNR